MGNLGELAALIRVKVDVVYVEGGSYEARVGYAVADRVGVARDLGRDVPAHVVDRVELQVDADLVVLEGDQRESKARVAVKPELEGDVERVLRGAADNLLR